ncbi:MAG: fructosamine kinase family protein [Alphaproteobacteria bacterium]|nr:fructosamine kinase family protein [Alphaproteobacteria bacterium]
MDPIALLRRAGLPAHDAVPLSGGDTSDAWRCGDVVVKTRARRIPGLFPAEADGLRRLAAHGVPVPTVHHADDDGLVIAYVPPGPADPEALGRTIAAMHAVRGHHHGLDATVFLGPIPLPGGTGPAWRDVFWTTRLEPLVRRTAAALGPRARRIEALAARVPLPQEGPRLLHGDLWSGNVVHGIHGPVLVDPSCWWGERAVDLAMMDLFGGFGGRCRAAYAEALPVPDAVAASVPFHQLLYLLVHVALFGDSYLSGVDGVLRRYR